MRIRLVSLATLVAALALTFCSVAGTALADGSSASGTTPTTPTTPTPPTTPPPAAPVAGSVHLYLKGVFTVHGAVVTVPRRPLTVEGVVRPYVAGQQIRVRAMLGHRVVKSQLLRIKPGPHGNYGVFTQRVASPGAGILRVSADHARTPQMLGFSSRRGIDALDESTHFGSRGRFVQLMQQRLAALHIYVLQSGVYDQHTGLAVDAYHRLLGWGVSQALGGATVSALLDGRGAFAVRYPHDGKHVEGNLNKQLIALIYGSRVYEIYPISSGKPSTPTVIGHFRVYRRTPGYLPDGMYYSSFFYSGYAIHGYSPAPDYAASHGCMRLPIVDAISVYDWLNYGDVVDVYH